MRVEERWESNLVGEVFDPAAGIRGEANVRQLPDHLSGMIVLNAEL